MIVVLLGDLDRSVAGRCSRSLARTNAWMSIARDTDKPFGKTGVDSRLPAHDLIAEAMWNRER